MESISALSNFQNNISQLNNYAHEYDDFMSKRQITYIEKEISEIKDKFSIDYSRPLKMTKKEEETLKRLIIEYNEN